MRPHPRWALMMVALSLLSAPPMASAEGYDGWALQQGLLAYERSLAEQPYAGDDIRAALTLGFIRGVGAMLGSPEACVPGNAPNSALVPPVEQWIIQHPEQGTQSPHLIVRHALAAAFPCTAQAPAGPAPPGKLAVTTAATVR